MRPRPVPHLRRQRVPARGVHASVLQARLLLSPKTGGGARAKEYANQATEEAAGDERGTDEAQLEGLEAFLAGAHEEDDAADGGGAQADVEQRVGSGALVVHAEEVFLFGAFAEC